MNKKLGIIGGDLRIAKLIEMLSTDGYEIYTYALEEAENISKLQNVFMNNNLEEVTDKADIIIGPIPLSSNHKEINTPFSSNNISLDDLFDKIKGKTFIAGALWEELYKIGEQNDIKLIDLMKREELAVLNTISTAEGAIQIAMQETLSTIHGAKVLVTGFGRVGKILSKMLDGIGANVYCEARKEADLAWIKAYGYTPIHLNELNKYLGNFDIIINTIPYLILDEERLNLVKEDCLIIDLASNPGGVDKNAAKAKGIKTIWALSLPGKVAPLTSAEFIKETIYNILKEI